MWLLAAVSLCVFGGSAEVGAPGFAAVLEASGTPLAERANTRKALEAALRTARSQAAMGATPLARARRLLIALHAPRGPLRTYDETASAVHTALTLGRFNCVSATVLYLLAASDLGFEVRAELLPTHARARVRVDAEDRWHIVETTSPQGLDPESPRPERSPTLEGRAESRALSPSEGLLVPVSGLLAAMYVNRAALEEREGRKVAALLEAGEALAQGSKMKAILRDQRAAVWMRLGVEPLITSATVGVAVLERAQRDLLRARALDVSDPRLAKAVTWNARAVSERTIRRSIEEDRIEAAHAALQRALEVEVHPSTRAALRALTLLEEGRRAARLGLVEAGLALVERGLEQPLGSNERGLHKGLELTRASLQLQRARAAAEVGAVGAAFKLLPKADKLGELGLSPQRERVRLARRAGHHHLESGDFEAAAAAFRRGLAEELDDPACRNDLVVALQRQMLETVPVAIDTHECDALEGLARELNALAPNDPFARQAQLRCYLSSARALAGSLELDRATDMLEAASTLLGEGRDRRWMTLARWIWARAETMVGEEGCEGMRRTFERLARLKVHPKSRMPCSVATRPVSSRP